MVEPHSTVNPLWPLYKINKVGLDYAERHLRVIERFGRFSNRSAAMGRQSTPEEEEFLAGPDAPFSKGPITVHSYFTV